MSSRLELHEILCELVNITEPDGDRHVYFNPPASVKMKYKAIRYNTKTYDIVFANDLIYNLKTCYELVVIDKYPESDLVQKVLMLPHCKHDRRYVADNLYHDVFTLFY